MIRQMTSITIYLFSSFICQFLIGDADYTGFDQNIVLPAGAMDFSYNVTILSDDIVEESEMFDVDLSYVSGSPLTVTGSDATVTIVDSSGETLISSYCVNHLKNRIK